MADIGLPLEGITVADFSWVLAGPRATEYLGAMGARVIKIEGPNRPDQFRSSPIDIPGSDKEKYSAVFWNLNYSKLGCTIDFTQPRGRELALRLIAQSDVVIENYAYGVMEKARLTYDDLRQVRPDIIMVSGSALGKSGPHRGHVTYGALLHGFCGLNAMTGYEGDVSGTFGGTFTDPLTGATLALAVLAGLWHRRRTGRGQFIDASMAETTIAQIPEAILDYTVNGRIAAPQGNVDGIAAPHNTYACREHATWVAIAVQNQRIWDNFRQAIGSPEWTNSPEFADQFRRWKNRATLDECVETWTRTQTADEAMHRLQSAGVPSGIVASSWHTRNDPHLAARGYFVEMEQEIVGRKPVIRLPWLLSPGPNGRYFPAPLLGEHNDVVFRDILGLPEEEMNKLRDEKVIL